MYIIPGSILKDYNHHTSTCTSHPHTHTTSTHTSTPTHTHTHHVPESLRVSTIFLPSLKACVECSTASPARSAAAYACTCTQSTNNYLLSTGTVQLSTITNTCTMYVYPVHGEGNVPCTLLKYTLTYPVPC